MADQDMFYVEVSRASEGFSLLTDDREALIERLETSLKTWDGALEAIGEDLDATGGGPRRSGRRSSPTGRRSRRNGEVPARFLHRCLVMAK